MAAIKRKAMLAAYALLGIVPKAHASDDDLTDENWNVDTSILSYSESNRISVFEPTVSVRRQFENDRALAMSFTVDTISGMTPIGTLPKNKDAPPNIESLSAASAGSGGGGSSAGGGVNIDVPTTHMADVRYGLNTSWQQRIGLGFKGQIGGDVSLERDFQSVGANFLLSRDFNGKNTTVSAGISPETDKIVPQSGVPIPFVDPTVSNATPSPYETKKELGMLVGLTQVINRRTLMEWNFAQTKENGDLSDPYKLLSLIDPVTGDPLSSVFEKRPRTRLDRSYFWLTRVHLTEDVVSFSYRYYTDDWGIRSHTVDLTYRYKTSEEGYLEPHFRYYHQGPADFYRIGLVDGERLPAFASADYRLSRFDAYTIGLRAGYHFGESSLLVLRFDYMTQVGDSHPGSAIGIQKGFDLFPALQALIFQVQLSFDPARIGDDIGTLIQ